MPTNFINGTGLGETLYGTNERDTGVAYDEVFFGQGGADLIYTGGGNDWVWASVGDPAGVTFFGGDGDDVLVSFDGADWLDGEAGNDILISGGGNDTLVGSIGDDQLWGGDGIDVLLGGDGGDVLVGEGGDDWLWGGAGNDTLIGVAGIDALSGEAGDDSLWGGDGADQLNGGDGADVIVGGGGGDFYVPGADLVRDVMIGGAGRDEFSTSGRASEQPNILSGFDVTFIGGTTLFMPRSTPGALNGVDVIWNFNVGEDVLKVAPSNIEPGATLRAQSFVVDGLFGTLVQTVDGTDNGTGIFPGHGVAFLAGVQTTYDALVAGGSIIVL